MKESRIERVLSIEDDNDDGENVHEFFEKDSEVFSKAK